MGRGPAKELKDIFNERSPLVKIIAQRYEREGLHSWNNDRVASLARALGKTLWVLCAEAGFFKQSYVSRQDLFRIQIDKAHILQCWKSNRWPVWAAIHFDRFEHYVKTNRQEPGATLLSVADGAAATVIAARR